MHINSLIATSSYSTGYALGAMEGQSDPKIPVALVPSASGGLSFKDTNVYVPRVLSEQDVVMSAERNDNCPVAQPLPHWAYQKQTSHNQVNFLPESSTALHFNPSRVMLEGVLLPVGSMQAGKGISEFQRNILYKKSRVAVDSNPTESSLDLHVLKPMPSTHMPNGDNHEASITPARFCGFNKREMMGGEMCNVPMAGCLSSHGEGEMGNKLTHTENQILAQNYAPSTEESNEDNGNVSQPYSTVTIAVPGSPSIPHNSVSRQKARTRSKITDRLRRAKIAEGFKALGELLPHSEEVSKAAALDDTVDYVKHLQLRIKALSQSRLAGEATAAPFIHLEGYGHYLVHQEMLNEPLEEMIGRLMEVDMAMATQLLESKGLTVMPIGLIEGLFQTG